MWADAKFQIARIPPDTIRSVTDCAAAGGRGNHTHQRLRLAHEIRQKHQRLYFPPVYPLANLLRVDVENRHNLPSRGCETSHTPAARCPDCRRRPKPLPSAGSSPESSRSSGPVRPAHIPPSVYRQFRSFQCPFGPVWDPAPERGQGRRRRPGRHRPSSSPAGSCSKSAGGEGWLRECRGGCWSLEFSYRESYIEKVFSIPTYYKCGPISSYSGLFLPIPVLLYTPAPPANLLIPRLIRRWQAGFSLPTPTRRRIFPTKNWSQIRAHLRDCHQEGNIHATEFSSNRSHAPRLGRDINHRSDPGMNFDFDFVPPLTIDRGWHGYPNVGIWPGRQRFRVLEILRGPGDPHDSASP